MDAVRAFVAKHSDALELVEVAIEPDAQSGERVTRQKVRCRLTGHELPAKLDAIKAHLHGKRFRQAKSFQSNEFVADLAPYAPHIVPHKRDEMLCYCTVTSKVLHRRKAELDAHVAGRRFRNELAQRKKAAEEGRELGDADAAAGGDEEAAGGDGEDAEEEEGEEEEDEEDGGVRAAGRHVSFAARAGAEDDGEEEEEGDEEENGEEEEGNEEEEADEAEENGDEEERGAGAGAATERKGPVPAAASSSFGFDEVPADWKAARPAGDSSSSDDERPAPSRKRVPDARAASRGPAKRARTAAQ